MIWKIAFVVLIVASAGLSLFVYNSMIVAQPKKVAPVVEVSPVPSAASEEVRPEVVDYSIYTVKVLNGSGVSGKAGEVAEVLKGENFTILSTGNADSYNYEKSVIRMQKTVKNEAPAKIKELLTSYTFEDSIETIDSHSEDADIVLIIGAPAE